jgi:hypothetical protein
MAPLSASPRAVFEDARMMCRTRVVVDARSCSRFGTSAALEADALPAPVRDDGQADRPAMGVGGGTSGETGARSGGPQSLGPASILSACPAATRKPLLDRRFEIDYSAVQRIQRPCSHPQIHNPRQASVKIFGNPFTTTSAARAWRTASSHLRIRDGHRLATLARS